MTKPGPGTRPPNGGRTASKFSQEILYLTAVLRLLEDRDDLPLAETRLPHCHFLHHTQSMMAEVSTYDLSSGMVSLRHHHEHRHSGIQHVTPAEWHNGEEAVILAQRQQGYAEARARIPRRWSRETRAWRPVGAVHLNPEKEPQDSTLAEVD